MIINFLKCIKQLRFKPVQMPDKEPDNEVFGKNDMNNEKLDERRRRAYNIAQEQKALIEQKKRDAILAKLAEQQVEEEVLDRAKNEYVFELFQSFQNVTSLNGRF